jgi:hypothetical protein
MANRFLTEYKNPLFTIGPVLVTNPFIIDPAVFGTRAY